MTTSNLKPLNKLHYSAGMEYLLFTAGAPTFKPEGLPIAKEYARIAGTFSLNAWFLAACASNKAVTDVLRSLGVPIGVNYSPWHQVYHIPPDPVTAERFGRGAGKYPMGGADPTDRAHPTWQGEIDKFATTMKAIAGIQGLTIGAVLLDCERFFSNAYTNDNIPGNDAAMAENMNIIADVTRQLFPTARVNWYGRGMKLSVQSRAISVRPEYLPDLTGESLACSIYTPTLLKENMELYRQTGELKSLPVVPWVSLGAGYPDTGGGYKYDWDYDTMHSYEIGRWLASTEAPYIVFFPQPFAGGTPAWEKHFTAYVKGVNDHEQVLSLIRSKAQSDAALQNIVEAYKAKQAADAAFDEAMRVNP